MNALIILGAGGHGAEVAAYALDMGLPLLGAIDDGKPAGPWQGTSDWKTDVKTIPVPIKAREMIVRIGLNGATGKLWLDDLSITPKPR